MSDEQTKRLVQLKQAYESGVLDQDTYETAVTALSQSLVSTPPPGSDLGVVSHGSQTTAVGQRGVHVGGSAGMVITGDHNVVVLTQKSARAFWSQFPQATTEEPNLSQATAQYLQYLVERYQYLDLKGLGISERLPIRLPLLSLYVPQHAQTDLSFSPRSVQTHDTLPPRALLMDLLKRPGGLVVLGDPGSGKTTFLKYLALKLALGQGEEIGMTNRLPLVLPLADYAEALDKKYQPLDEFLPRYYRRRGIALSLKPMIDNALLEGRALLLLDGLDQVATPVQRHVLIEQVMNFYASYRQQGNQFVFTSRVIGYHAMRPTAPGLTECTLMPFDDVDVATFIEYWTLTIERLANGDNDIMLSEAKKTQLEMRVALEQNPGVRQLATNPLMLTILALLKRQGFTLLEKRVEVYQQYIDTLLRYWHIARSLGRPPGPTLDVFEARQIFAALALMMQETSPGLNAIDGRTLTQYLKTIFRERGAAHPGRMAETFLHDVQSHASLLVERGPGQFGFSHQTLQEYLAATAVADLGQQAIDPVIDKLTSHLEEDVWRESVLFVTGYLGLIQRRPGAASDLLLALMRHQTRLPGMALVLAGEAAADSWPGGITADCRRETVAALQSVIEDVAHVPVMERIRAGRALARLGDPRPEVLSVDEMLLAFVPASPFWMGAGAHKHLNETITRNFWLGKYPVTHAQYGIFVADGGYKESRYWSEAAEVGRWRDGFVQSWANHEWRESPQAYGPPFDLPNHPAVGVSFFEALAFTRWLTDHWRDKGFLPAGWTVQLPSEAEWELGARGGQKIPLAPYMASAANLPVTVDVLLQDNPYPQRLFPGANEPTTPAANFNDTGVKTTHCVGCFRQGSSVTGCEELSGNVWEWTRSRFADYPYTADDGRESSAIKLYQHLALRGGAYWSSIRDVRCTARARRSPNDANSSYGFRIVILPYTDR